MLHHTVQPAEHPSLHLALLPADHSKHPVQPVLLARALVVSQTLQELLPRIIDYIDLARAVWHSLNVFRYQK